MAFDIAACHVQLHLIMNDAGTYSSGQMRNLVRLLSKRWAKCRLLLVWC